MNTSIDLDARAERPEPSTPDSPQPPREPNPEPWHDPGPPVRKVDLPPDSPTRAVPVESPERREPPEPQP